MGKDHVCFSATSSLLRPSTSRRKSRGESGKPFIKPLSDLKKGEAEPFMSTEKETVLMEHIIHLMKGTGKPKCFKRSRR
jgi:hypothetical protein